MKKRILSLLCVMALCLGLLPTAALAAEGALNTLYVGNESLPLGEDSYWTTNQDTGLLTQYTGSGDNWNVKYESSSNTLTLNEAKISGSYHQYNNPFTAGIYAKGSSDQPVALTIELIGENTITGNYGIYVDAQQGETVGTNASLLIRNSSDNGRLEVSGSSHGIYVKSGTGNASLTINDASVVASSSSTLDGYAGVCVQSSSDATSSPQLSLAVNGGSLTTSASEGNDGIQFYVGAYGVTSATTSLTVTDNAIVDARNGGISASRILETLPTPTPTGENSSGIVFDGTEGTVYGNVTLDEPLTVGAGETLTVPSGSSLNCNGKLTNNGTILASGGTVTGSLSGGSTVTTPSITAQPTGNTVTEGSAAEFSITATAGSETPTYQWQQSTDNGSNWTNIESATSASYTTGTTTTSMSGFQYRCVVTSASGVSVISQAATLTVQAKPAPVPVTGVSLDKATLELFTGGSATLTATVLPETATDKSVTWESNNANVATVEGGTVTAKGAGEATITVTTADGGKQATCKVKVTQATYSISADISPDFGSVYTGYDRPAAQTVTITNTGNQSLTLNQPASTSHFEVGTLSKTPLAPGEKATFTVQPKAGLAAGVYREEIQVSGSGNVTLSIPVSFSVQAAAAPQVTPAPAATPAPSDNITYYTCQACGYHNWTATEAGYRCDHCGYLESTRQLSGYGNVKGSYTPGSSAAAPAASTIPQTGDESNPVLWTVLLLVSGLALGGLALRRKTEHSRS